MQDFRFESSSSQLSSVPSLGKQQMKLWKKSGVSQIVRCQNSSCQLSKRFVNRYEYPVSTKLGTSPPWSLPLADFSFLREFAAKASEFFNKFQIEKFTELSYT